MLQLLQGFIGCAPQSLRILLSPILLMPVALMLIIILRAFSIQIVVMGLVSTLFFMTLILMASVSRNANLHTDGLHGADLHNDDHHNTESSEFLLEGMLSKGGNQARETDIGDFEASMTREESHSAHEKRSLVKMKPADAECFARPWSERNRCWAQWLLPTGQRRSCGLSCVELAGSTP
jgi:hypothetical protein